MNIFRLMNTKKIVGQLKNVLIAIGNSWQKYKNNKNQSEYKNKLKELFKLRYSIFLKKKIPESENYPYKIIDPYQVFGEENKYGDLNLIGNEWLNINSLKPVAILWGFNNWKWGFVSNYLPEYRTAFAPRKITSINSIISIERFEIKPEVFIVWGYTDSPLLRIYAKYKKISIYRIEDGFIRSSELGATHSTPYSLIIDRKGLHYNHEEPSDIEEILNNGSFTKEDLTTAKTCMDLMHELKLSKYNPPSIESTKAGQIKIRKIIAVLGQVDNDMSVRLGNPDRWTMTNLIQLAKYENPDADIVYRPHPEIYRGYQKSKFRMRQVEKICKLSTPDMPLMDFLDNVDHVYTISSLSGLEALLRGIKVTVVGGAFYAGWGLTDDRLDFPRRKSKLTLTELFSGIYLKYPRYLADIEDSAIGFQAACFRIKADHDAMSYLIAAKNVANLHDLHEIASSDYWPQLFFGKKSNEIQPQIDKLINYIDFRKLMYIGSGRLFQKSILFSMCGKIKTNEARDIFITKIRTFIDADIFNELLIALQKYHPGNYVVKQTTWLLNENDEQSTSVEVLKSHLDKITSSKFPDKNSFDNASITSNQHHNSELPNKLDIDDNQKEILLSILDQLIEKTNYEEAIDIATHLFITGHGTSEVLLKIAEISELKFDILSARSISDFCKKIDLYGFNRKALSINLMNLPTEEDEINPLDLMCLLTLQFKLSPERINATLAVIDSFSRLKSFEQVLRSMINLDNNISLQKSIAYLELNNTEKSMEIVKQLIVEGNKSDKIRVAYSKNLSAINDFNNALSVINEARISEPSILYFRESIRILNYTGNFNEALELIKDAEKNKIHLSENLHITTKLGLKRVGDGYKHYLQIPFRNKLINYFGEKYLRTITENLDNLIVLAAYGPGDEIRFASIYNDLSSLINTCNFKITCDYRLFNTLKRSFEKIDFIPVKRTRNYSKKYPRDLYNKLPGSDLCTILDNNGYSQIIDSKNIILITDLIHRCRKDYTDFPGIPYFKYDRELSAKFAKKLPGNIKLVGLSWRSSLTSHSRNESYLYVEELSPIFNISGLQYVNLQYDECQNELDWIEQRYPGKIINISEIDLYNDFDSLAALMKCMDLIIAPATNIIEFAGALGCPAWFLSNSCELHWRKIDQFGTDVWHNSTTHIEGSTVGDKKKLVDQLYINLLDFSRNK
jgi:capsular polysaccharide export protein